MASIKHTDTGFSSVAFEMPLDGLEEANQQRSEQALKLARSVITAANGPFIDENWFWSPLYAMSPQETHDLEARKKVDKIVDKLGSYNRGPILIDSVNEVRRVLHIGQLGSFDKEMFQPYRFNLHDDGRFVPWDDDRIAVTGSLEIAINELETPGIFGRHHAENFGFTNDVEPIEVARIRTLYANRGVFQLDELVGNVYVGMDKIMRSCGKLGDSAVRLVQDYHLAETEQRKQKRPLRQVS